MHAGILFSMVIVGTKSTYIDRSTGRTYTHWEVSIFAAQQMLHKYAAAAAYLDL